MALLMALWMAAFALAADHGIFAQFDARPPPFAAVIGLTVIGGAILAFSPVGTLLVRNLPLAALVGAQGFRLPLELVLHAAVREGVAPVQMSYDGANFDIVSGASALVVAALLVGGRLGQRAVWIWNVVGALLLLNIVSIAIASTPVFHTFGREPARLSTFVAYPPFIWLPTVCVMLAIAGHLLVTRRLSENAG
jgi:hypothetical protein